MAKRLYVGNLAWATTQQSLKDFFSQIGDVASAEVVVNKFNGRSKGFGFVEMASDELAAQAIEKLNRQQLDGRMVFVNEAKPLEPRAPRTGGYGGDRRGGYNAPHQDGGYVHGAQPSYEHSDDSQQNG